VGKQIRKSIVNCARRGAAKLKDWSRYLLIATSLAVAPIALANCTEPDRQEQPRRFVEDTGIWSEPYHGEISSDHNGNYYMANRLVMNFNSATTESEVLELTREFDGRVTGEIPQLNAFEVEVNDLDAAIDAMRMHSKVKLATRNYYFEAAWDNDRYIENGEEPLELETLPNFDILYKGLWWSKQIKLSEGLNLIESSETRLEPVTIAVIDTSFDMDDWDIPYFEAPPDTPAEYSGYDFGDNDDMVHSNGWLDEESGLAGSHGTIVSSFIAAINNSERTNGVASVGTDRFSILPLKISPGDNLGAIEQILNTHIAGDDFRIASALIYASLKADEYNIGVVNLSIGAAPLLPEWLPVLEPDLIHLMRNRTLVQYAIDDLTSRNIIVVAAAGNNNGDACGVLPSAHRNVISVGGTNIREIEEETREGRFFIDGTGSSHSANVECLEVAAPAEKALMFGRDALEWIEGDDWRLSEDRTPILGDGTSLASPQVAGLVALIRSINPELTYPEIVQLLRDNADDVPLDDDPNPLVRGQIWKRINVLNTVQALIHEEEPPDPPTYICDVIVEESPATTLTDFDGDYFIAYNSTSVMYLGNTQTGEMREMVELTRPLSGAISGNRLFNSYEYEIYEIDSELVTGIREDILLFLQSGYGATNFISSGGADIDGDTIVFQVSPLGGSAPESVNGIYSIGSGMVTEIGYPEGYTSGGAPRIHRSRVIQSFGHEIFVYEIEGDRWSRVADCAPEGYDVCGNSLLDGNRVVFGRAPTVHDPLELSLHDLISGVTSSIPLSRGAHTIQDFDLQGERLVFISPDGNDVQMFDFSTNLESVAYETESGYPFCYYPLISDNTIIFSVEGEGIVACTIEED